MIPVFKKVKKSLDSISIYDETIKSCKDILNTYSEICNKLSDVVRAEKEKSKEERDRFVEDMKQAFIAMAGKTLEKNNLKS